MGQAFDRDGAILGEIEAATKREVFDKLINLHPNAHEIRIKTLKEKLDEADKALFVNPAATTPGDPLLQFFAYSHLPERLGLASQPFCELAHRVVREHPRNPERTVTLRKLLEAKDAAVRNLLWKD